ncbi:MAG: bifunctional 4-hydroxy-3-methylbut-2-enyl diphosphate reductase/30S ribosomal protein S1 [Eubacteriales bacterium]|nr:bifunctional 4-hydroxy-3-methylbut-2-enyl diphosphate reductase/30S ribosomal protein S1 [Eubacteriales bacterium]
MIADIDPNINVAESAGFCFGVDNAVKTAFQLVSECEISSETKEIYMLGRLIHNKEVINQLMTKGMKLAVDPEDVTPGSTVLVRAHGIPPEVLRKLKEQGADVIDCTCPYVRKIHNIVRKAFVDGKQIIIIGDPNHPEVEGINGECDYKAIVIDSADSYKINQIEDVDTIIVAQTTFSLERFKDVCDILNKKIAKLEIFGTICSTTEKRQKEARELAVNSDIMIVIGDRESSNTRKLYDICLSECRNTYLVEKSSELDELIGQDISPETRIGIAAGASTPERNIGEVISKMSEKVTQENQQEKDNMSFQEYVENIPQLHRGATVKGNVVRYDDDYIYVDVKDKSEGRVPVSDFASDPDFDLEKAANEKQEIDVYVRSIKNSEQAKEIILSRAKGENVKGKELTETAFSEQIPVTVKITNIVRDGVIGTYEGIDIYIHRTQLELHPVDDLESYKGKSLDILITQFDSEKRRLRVSGSRRTLISREREERAGLIWDDLEKDKIYNGIVRSLVDFGAFVDIGGVDGLVHISELSWKRIKHPSEVVKPGDEIEVYIKDFDREKSRISLGYKNPDNDPYKDLEEKFPVGSVVTGKVVRMVDFGAFIEIAPNIDALCHVTQISSVRLEKPSDVLKEGMEVKVRIMTVSSDTKRISVSIKEVEPIDPPHKDDDISVDEVQENGDTNITEEVQESAE